MRLHVLVEGAADAAFVNAWCARCVPQHDVKVHPHQGKGHLPTNPEQQPGPRRRELLHQLPAKLRAYGKTLDPATERVVVLVDADDQDCADLKRRLASVLKSCDPAPVVAFCIAIEETEAFFLGDPQALRRAYPRADLAKLDDYQQDSVCGTAELLQTVIGDTFEDKRAWAERITPHLSNQPRGRPRSNRSPSFHYLRRQLLLLTGERDESGLHGAGRRQRAPRRR